MFGKEERERDQEECTGGYGQHQKLKRYVPGMCLWCLLRDGSEVCIHGYSKIMKPFDC